MKKILIACLLFSTQLVIAQDYSVDPMPAPVFRGIFNDKYATLQSGTVILLETLEKVQTDAVTVGQNLQFKVRTNVMSENEVVIRTGAMSLGRVKSIEPATRNNPEEIRIELLYVQAVDGQTIPLNGNEQTIRGAFPGQGVSVEAGTTISAFVTNNVSIHHD